MSFDQLATAYRAMEWTLAGGKLQRCRTALLPHLASAREVLVVGEGPGRWIEAACAAMPSARFTVVDASAQMVSKAKSAWRTVGGSGERIRFFEARLPCALPRPAAGYDLVVTSFFLDCFAPEPLAEIVACLGAAASREARWLVCDFRLPKRGLARWRAQAVLALAHWFFRQVTDISARRLTDPSGVLSGQGFELEIEVLSDWGLLSASLWGRRPVSPAFAGASGSWGLDLGMSHTAPHPEAKDLFDFCARCGARRTESLAPGTNPYRCESCGFTYYFNTASAVAVFIEDADGQVLFIRRGREPAQGKLAMAGGFTDPGETGEQATRREIREELGLELAEVRYVGTWPNVYQAGGFIVHVLDIFYRARLASTDMTLDADEVSGAEWLDPAQVDPADIAFPSMRNALAAYLAGKAEG